MNDAVVRSGSAEVKPADDAEGGGLRMQRRREIKQKAADNLEHGDAGTS